MNRRTGAHWRNSNAAGNLIPLGWEQLPARRLLQLFSRYKPEGAEPEEQLKALEKALGLQQ